MLISYPILGVTMKESFADSALEKNVGTYPVTPGQAWHGGVHINFPATAGNEVRAIADGIVIAFRAPTEKPNDASALDGHPLNYSGWTDDGFVLIKHEKESGENTKVTFFSLYMHLSELFKPLKGSAGAIQQGGDIKVKRKQKIGKLGSIYGRAPSMHFEIFMGDAELNTFFKRGKDKYKVDANGCGDKDLWGDVHFVIPSGTTYYHDEPNTGSTTTPQATSKTTEETLCVTIQYRTGDRIVRTYRESGEQIGQQTDKEYKVNKGYEYNLYKLAQQRFPKNTSAGYELLRHGRVYGPDAAPPNAHNLQYIPLGFGRQGWVDLNQASIKKLSDADFPYWQWRLLKEDSGVFDPTDGKCEVAELLQAIDPDRDGIVAPLEFKWFLKDKKSAARLQNMVCQFPCEWDASDADKKWGWLKEYFKNPAVLKKELAEKHKKWIDGVKTRSDNQLKTIQTDLKAAQDAKKEKQATVAELRKAFDEITKKNKTTVDHIKIAEKASAKLHKDKHAKPEAIAKADKDLEESRQSLEEGKTEQEKAKNALLEVTSQIEDCEVAIRKIEAKREALESTLKSIPNAIESADKHIKEAEEALKNPSENKDPEASWKRFKAHLNALQWWDKVKPLASPSIWYFHPLAFIDHFRKCHWLNGEELRLTIPDAIDTNAKRFYKSINQLTFKYLGYSRIRSSYFIGQMAHETGSLSGTMAENGNSAGSRQYETDSSFYTGPDTYQKFIKGQGYEALRNTLGNENNSGDGIKFRGRGSLQVTGRVHYASYWIFRGWLDPDSFDQNWWNKSGWWDTPRNQSIRPAVIMEPQKISARVNGGEFNPIDVGGWFWIRHDLNKLIDADISQRDGALQSNAVSAVINKYDGSTFDARKKRIEHAKKILCDG